MIKLNFKIAPAEYDIEKVYRFLNPDKDDWDWSNYVKKCYPSLNRKKSKKEVKKFIIQFRKENNNDIQKKLLAYKKEFKKISRKIILEFIKLLELKKIKTNKINILISLSPINPYDLGKKEFSVYWNFPIKDMIAISIHEIFHFIYYEKWKEIFPKTTIKDFEPPSLIWHLSELIVPIVLNDERIQNIFKYNYETYKEYNKLKINKKNINEIILNLYKNRKGFSQFVKELYSIVLKHEKEIQKI
jgi:hypothetical protein